MRVIAILVALVFVAGCKIADTDRCPGEMVYLAENRVCICPAGTVFNSATEACEVIEDTDDTDDTDIDAGADGGDDLGGFGEECSEDADCAEFEEATFCVIDPLSSEGYCSLGDCDSGDCPGGWQCCDCSSLIGWVACLDDSYAQTAASMGCECAP